MIAFLTESLRRVLSRGAHVDTDIAVLGFCHSCVVRSCANANERWMSDRRKSPRTIVCGVTSSRPNAGCVESNVPQPREVSPELSAKLALTGVWSGERITLVNSEDWRRER